MNKEFNDSTMNIYPNHAAQEIEIEINLEKSQTTKVTVLNSSGQVVGDLGERPMFHEILTYDYSEQPPGTFYVKMDREQEMTIKKVVLIG